LRQVVVNEKIVDKEFLAIYLSDGIGKLELDSVSDYLQDGHGINRDMFIHESNLMNASLLLPDIETQKSLVQTFKKITKLARNVSQFKKNLLLVPGNYEKIDDKADEMNKIFHSFSKIDKINSQIADANETDKIEYKASFHYSDRSKKKSSTNQKRALRAICGFLNRDGGKLYIGVSERDKKPPFTINGIDEEIKNLHEDSYEKFVLYFSQTIENQLSMGREEWGNFIKFDKIVMHNKKSIFEVACKFHDKGPVSLKGKEDVLYVRQYAEVKAYRGNEMKNYEREHWKK
jgi:hypothetical protein